MKHIKQEDKKELTLKCVDLISKTFVELGQSKSAEEIALAQITSKKAKQRVLEKFLTPIWE